WPWGSRDAMVKDEIKQGFEHIERLHRRLHTFMGHRADAVITAISKEALTGFRSYVQLLEEADKKVIAGELPRQAGGRNRTITGTRKAVGHPWTRSGPGIRRTEDSD